MSQNPVPVLKRSPAESAVDPQLPVIANCGSMSAMATPASADAKCMFSSAWRTSGRCSTSFEGRLTGSSAGSVNSAS